MNTQYEEMPRVTALTALGAVMGAYQKMLDRTLIIVIIEAAGCNGCIVKTLKEVFFEAIDKVDLRECRVLTTAEYPEGPIDVLIVEGTIVAKEEIHKIQFFAKRARHVVAAGACAELGGFPASASQAATLPARNGSLGKLLQSFEPLARPIPLSAIPGITVHANLHGCAPKTIQVQAFFAGLIAGGARYDLIQQAQCVTCKENATECLLKRTESDGSAAPMDCGGQEARGGCGGPCMEVGIGCFMCNGFVDHGSPERDIIRHKAHVRTLTEDYKIPIGRVQRLYYAINRYAVESNPELAQVLGIDLERTLKEPVEESK